MDNLLLKIDVTDWRDEALRDESLPQKEEDIIAAIQSGKQTMRVARDLIVAQEMGTIPHLTRPNKTLLNAGAAYDVATLLKRQKQSVETVDGNTYEIPAYIGRLGRTPDDSDQTGEQPDTELKEEPVEIEPSYVLASAPAAMGYALRYLEGFIPGNIWNKLLEVYYCGGDVRAQADALPLLRPFIHP